MGLQIAALVAISRGFRQVKSPDSGVAFGTCKEGERSRSLHFFLWFASLYRSTETSVLPMFHLRMMPFFLLHASSQRTYGVVVPEVRKLLCDEISPVPSRWDFTGCKSKHVHLIDCSSFSSEVPPYHWLECPAAPRSGSASHSPRRHLRELGDEASKLWAAPRYSQLD